METVEITENTVNPGQLKVGPQDFELLKVLGKGGYGKVILTCFVVIPGSGDNCAIKEGFLLEGKNCKLSILNSMLTF